MRFQDAARDARAVVYAGIQADPLVARVATLLADATAGQRVLARAVMNGQSDEPQAWRVMFPTLFDAGDRPGPDNGVDAVNGAASDDAVDVGVGVDAGADEQDRSSPDRRRSEDILAASLAVAGRGEQVRSQFRGAIVEALTARLLEGRVPPDSIRRERRILFDGVAAEIHPYDVTVERPGGAEAYDCKWGARGISADVLHQLDDARAHATDEGERLLPALVVFDARRSCEVRLARQTAPRTGTRLVAIETLDRLAGRRAGGTAGTP